MGSSPAKRATTSPIPQEPNDPGVDPYAVPHRGGLAQLVRASVLHTEGQRFESSIPHHSPHRPRAVTLAYAPIMPRGSTSMH